MFMNLPCKSNLVLLTVTGAGLVGAGELSSLVGVSCSKKQKEKSQATFIPSNMICY